MNAIATSVDDSFQRMREKLDAEKLRPHHAMDPYFYRSHLVHEQELEHLIFKSWIYALHASEIPTAGDYQLVEIGEEYVEIFEEHGGEHLDLVPSLNAEDDWADAVTHLIQRHL